MLDHAEREDATSFDAPGARHTHRDGLCSFELPIYDALYAWAWQDVASGAG